MWKIENRFFIAIHTKIHYFSLKFGLLLAVTLINNRLKLRILDDVEEVKKIDTKQLSSIMQLSIKSALYEVEICHNINLDLVL